MNEIFNLAYFKGVFNTYAEQNNPGVNLSYGFGIDDFTFTNSILKSFKKSFPEFSMLDFELLEITKDDIIKLIDKWFYSEFKPNSINYKPTYEIIENIVNDLILSFNIKNFYKISNLNKNGQDIGNEFGLIVDFIIISSETKAYFCDFILDG